MFGLKIKLISILFDPFCNKKKLIELSGKISFKMSKISYESDFLVMRFFESFLTESSNMLMDDFILKVLLFY